jgi:hypothetical protein
LFYLSLETRLKILSSLHEKCVEKDPLYQSRASGSNKQQRIEQISEQEVCDEILMTKDPQQSLAIGQSEGIAIAMLLNKAQLTSTDDDESKDNRSKRPSFAVKVAPTLDTSEPASDWNKAQPPSPTQFQAILSQSPRHFTVDVVPPLEPAKSPPHEPISLSPSSQAAPHILTLDDEPELVSHSIFSHESTFSPFNPKARKVDQVPLLPLKEFLPHLDDWESALPYGWEERITDDEDGTLYYFNTMTEETLRHEIHPSDLLENNWRRCVTVPTDEQEEGQKYFFNDMTGATSWEAPHDAFADSSRLSLSSSDLARESSNQDAETRAAPPVPKFLRIPLNFVTRELTSDTIPSDLCERDRLEEDDGLDAELALNSDEGSAGSKPQTAEALVREQELREEEQEKEKEVLDGMFGTFTSFYSAKNQGVTAVETTAIDEFADTISALDKSFAVRQVDTNQGQLIAGYSSNDGDRDDNSFEDGDEMKHNSDRGNSTVSNEDSVVKNRALINQSSSFASSHGGDDSVNPSRGDSEGRDHGPIEIDQKDIDEDPFANNPESWIVRHDTNGLKYYENTISGETSWEMPSCSSLARPLDPQSVEPPPSTIDPADLAAAWQMYFTETGIPYYFNTRSGESQWTIPSSLQENNEMIIRSNSAASYLADLTPLQSHRESFVARYGDIYSLLDPPPRSDGVDESGREQDAAEESPYLIDLMDFTPKGRKISDLL